MGVYQKGKNWYIDYWLPGRKRRREKVGESRKLAELALKKRKLQIAEKKFLDIEPVKKVKLRTFCSTFIENYSKPNKTSWKNDQLHLFKLCSFFGDITLDEITPFKIEEFKKQRLNEGVKYATINRALASLRTMLYKAVEWDMLKESPMKSVKLFKENNTRLRFLEKEEISRLLKACSPHVKQVVIFALNTGLRRSEVFNLKWQDVDLKNNLIYVIQTKTKDKKVIPINVAVRNLLLDIRSHHNTEYVFCFNGNKINSVRKGFENATRRAGINDFRFHDLRHTFASHLVMKGVDLNTVRELLGHKKIDMTLRYAHLSQGHKAKAVELLREEIDVFETPIKELRNDEKDKTCNALNTLKLQDEFLGFEPTTS